MAATEETAPAPVEAPVEAPEAAAPAPAFDDSYDESLLIKVKGKVKRPVRPDDTERNLQVQKLQEQIDKASARVKEIKEILDSRATGKGVVNPQQQAIRDRIQQLRGEFDAIVVGAASLESLCYAHAIGSLVVFTRSKPCISQLYAYHRITACCLHRPFGHACASHGIHCCALVLQLQKKRLQSQNDDKKTERDKLIAEQRSIRDTIRGPSNLQVGSVGVTVSW